MFFICIVHFTLIEKSLRTSRKKCLSTFNYFGNVLHYEILCTLNKIMVYT